jgi:two-component system, NarL family, sensor histidine kinase UhpB
MSLRTRIHLIIAALSLAFLLLALTSEIENLRQATREEISTANSVASLVLIASTNALVQSNPDALVPYLESLGRVRAHEIKLTSNTGAILYQSPPSTYKSGRSAPQWFVALMQPETLSQQNQLTNGMQLELKADASRTIIDAWDDLMRLALVGAVLVALLNSLVFWLASRALAPLPIIVNALDRLRAGEKAFRLPKLAGTEANAIGTAFNNMATSIEEKSLIEQRARETEARLEERRELSRVIDRRIEEERKMIARELHDEFSQSMTAIRSLAVSIASSTQNNANKEAAQLISTEAARVYDAMHSLIPRITPLSLDSLGLIESLLSMIDTYKRSHPHTQIAITHSLNSALGASVTLALYRVAQEALSNALRHAHPTAIDIDVKQDDSGISIHVKDNGAGLADDWSRPGRFGLRGLRERIEQLHGKFQIANAAMGGVELFAHIPTPRTQE